MVPGLRHAGTPAAQDDRRSPEWLLNRHRLLHLRVASRRGVPRLSAYSRSIASVPCLIRGASSLPVAGLILQFDGPIPSPACPRPFDLAGYFRAWRHLRRRQSDAARTSVIGTVTFRQRRGRVRFIGWLGACTGGATRRCLSTAAAREPVFEAARQDWCDRRPAGCASRQLLANRSPAESPDSLRIPGRCSAELTPWVRPQRSIPPVEFRVWAPQASFSAGPVLGAVVSRGPSRPACTLALHELLVREYQGRFVIHELTYSNATTRRRVASSVSSSAADRHPRSSARIRTWSEPPEVRPFAGVPAVSTLFDSTWTAM